MKRRCQRIIVARTRPVIHANGRELLVEGAGEHFQGADGGALAGGVGVEGEDDVATEALHQADLLLGDGGAHASDDVGVAELVGGDGIHVALDDDDLVAATGGILGEVETKEEGALVEDGGLLGVEVLRLSVAEGAAAEADGAALAGANGKEEAVVEAIAIAAALALHDDAGFHRRG